MIQGSLWALGVSVVLQLFSQCLTWVRWSL